MRGVANPEAQQRAVQLRVERRLSLTEIAAEVGASKGSVSSWVRDHPLTQEEVTTRHAGRRYSAPMKDRGQESKFHRAVDVGKLDRRQKMKIAESATLFRLSCFSFNSFRPAFDGDRVDWIVQTQKGLLKLQVRWAKKIPSGLPVISLLCIEEGKQRRYSREDFDFIAGYDFFSDTAYVYSFDETAHCQTSISISEDAAERWDKLAG